MEGHLGGEKEKERKLRRSNRKGEKKIWKESWRNFFFFQRVGLIYKRDTV